MSRTPAQPRSLQTLAERARAVAKATDVPGLSMAVAYGDHRAAVSVGVLNARSGVEATPESLHQIGSITKVFTATLVMQAWEEGLIDLDGPVRPYLNGAQFGRGEEADRVTVRQLLCHTSGHDGDLFEDVGRDDDCLARYLVLCRDLNFLAKPGAHYNYCNAGYSALGRLIELRFGDLYDAILRERVLNAIGAARATALAEEAMLHRAAVGHYAGPDGKTVLAPLTLLPRACVPAGLSLYATASDLVAFATAHMSAPEKRTQESPIGAAAARMMRAPQVDLPDGSKWGLGWKLIPGKRTQFFGHDGGTVGQSAFLWCAPDAKLAIAGCFNGGASLTAYQRIAFPIFEEICDDIPLSAIPEVQKGEHELAPYEGNYENQGITMIVSRRGNRLNVVAKHKYFAMPDTIFDMGPIGAHRFRATIGDDDKVVTSFAEFDAAGKARLFYAGRLHRRIGA